MTPAPESVIVAAVVAVAAAAAGPVIRMVLRRRGQHEVADELEALRAPVRLLALTLFLRIALGATEPGSSGVASLLTVLLVAAGAWVVVRLLLVGQAVLFHRLEIDRVDNLRARSRRTQVELVRRMITVAVVSGTTFAVLVTVTPLGSLGPSLVAYAGLIGVVLGLALRAPLENLVAGIIVAVTEPVRIDDVVVVEGEWGKVEQIGLVNIVVRIWDDRRLVLPTSYFVTNAFENWTRRSAAVTGTVLLSTDYDVPVDDLRAEFERIVERSPLWDGRTRVLQVVELGEQSVQLRGIVTAANASDAWDLRCEVRERLLEFFTTRAGTMPVVRVDRVGELQPA